MSERTEQLKSMATLCHKEAERLCNAEDKKILIDTHHLVSAQATMTRHIVGAIEDLTLAIKNAGYMG